MEFMPLVDSFGARINASQRSKLPDFSEIADIVGKKHCLILSGYNVPLEEAIDYISGYVEHNGKTLMDYVGSSKARKTVPGNPKAFIASLPIESGASIYLHGEQHYQYIKPEQIFFYHHKVASTGGQPILASGKEIWHHLPENYKRAFDQADLVYKYEMTQEHWSRAYGVGSQEELKIVLDKLKNRCRLEYSIDRDVLKVQYYVSAAPIDPRDGKRIFINNIIPIVCEIPGIRPESKNDYSLSVWLSNGDRVDVDFCKKLKMFIDPVIVELRPEPGDIAFIDNHRVLHGRRGFVGQREVIAMLQGSKPMLEFASAA